ncbi:MAG: histidinol phosphate phosphatase domain-containing protein [Armatimonadota bacterium]
MLYDFHTHTFLSDGELLPMELIRRCVVKGYTALGISDHVSFSTVERVISEAKRDAESGNRHWGIDVLVGAELTHVPAAAIADAASHALASGAQYVVVHGETVAEPVEPGTNHAAIISGKVDILAHPGLITLEDARLAAGHDVFLEITCRRGHSLTNGRVVRLGREAGAKFLINTDAHAPEDLLTEDFAAAVARGAGLTDEEVDETLYQNPKLLLKRIKSRGR